MVTDWRPVLLKLPGGRQDSNGTAHANCPVCNGKDSLFTHGPPPDCANSCPQTKILALLQKRGLSLPDTVSEPEAVPTAEDISEETPNALVSWPEPLGKAALYGLAGAVVNTIEPHTESDPAALLFQFLVCFGNLIGRSSYFLVEADRHYPNLFACIVGRSAKGRKGTSLGHVRGLLSQADYFWVDERIKSGVSSGEGLIYAVRDEAENNQDKRLLAVESEFATILRVIEREGNTVSARIRDAWDSGRLYTLTKTAPLKATNAHISIIGHCTAEELRRYMTRTEMGNGFANRFLWVCATRSKLLPDGGNLNDDALRPFIEEIAAARDFASQPRELKRDWDARDLWREKYPRLTADVPGLLGAVVSRAEAQVTRLSLLYALLDCSETIQQVHLEAALALWEYAEASARFVFGDSTGDPVSDRIIAHLRATPGGTDRVALHNVFNRNLKAEHLNEALLALEQSGSIRREKRPATSMRGREAEVWHLI